jgi:antitoxin HicB
VPVEAWFAVAVAFASVPPFKAELVGLWRSLQRCFISEMTASQRLETSVSSHEYRCAVLFEPAGEGGFVVTCPALPGLVTEGDTLEEARAMAADAIRGYLEALAKDGLPIPPEDPQPRDEILQEIIAVVIEQA